MSTDIKRMIRFYVGRLVSSIYNTRQYWINKYKAGALDTANAMTLINNRTNTLIAEHAAEMERLENESKEKAANIKPLIITNDCNAFLLDVDRMSDELIDSLP